MIVDRAPVSDLLSLNNRLMWFGCVAIDGKL